MTNLLFSIFILFICNTWGLSQTWLKFHSTLGFSRCYDGQQTKDGGFILAGSAVHKGFIAKTDMFGTNIWERNYYGGNFLTEFRSIVETKDGGFVAVGSLDTASNSNISTLYVVKVNNIGNIIWEKKFGALPYGSSFWDVIETSDGGIATVGALKNSNSNLDLVLTKLDSSGALLWTHQIDSGSHESATNLRETLDGGFIIAGSKNANAPFLIKTDALGNMIWSTSIPPPPNDQIYINSIRQLIDSSFIAVGLHQIANVSSAFQQKVIYIAKISKNGQVSWKNEIIGNNVDYDPFSMQIAQDGGILIVGSKYTPSPYFDANAFLIKTDSSGNLLWEKKYYILKYSYIHEIEELKNNQIILYGWAAQTSSTPQAFVATTDYSGCLLSNRLVGNISHDINSSCTRDSLDISLADITIQIKGNGQTTYIRSDSSGNFQTHLDTGLYTFHILPPNNSPYWTTCPIINTIHLDTLSNSDTINLLFQATLDCPFMSVDISAPFIRRGINGSYYQVQYCNWGTATSQNTIIKVEVDPYLNVTSSSIPIFNQQGNVYYFNVGNLNYNECGNFNIHFFADTSAILGQTHCSKAYISSDTTCVNSLWNGPLLEVEANCQNDSVFFEITNTGTTMSTSHQYFIYQDSTLVLIDSILLGNNQSIIIPQYASMGSTYTIRVLQADSLPDVLGDSILTVAVEGCTRLHLGTFSTGFVTQFPIGNSTPSQGTDCQPNIGSFDPNDKSALPKGYGDVHHYVSNNTSIDYTIRFQNTGTDTAFNIIILDTISNYFDVSSIYLSTASHPYVWSIENGNILKVMFNNIMLPDSNINESLSHGFFKYSISQKSNNPVGTILNNSASIYFDNNLPIKTNQTWHTVGNNFSYVNLDLTVQKTYTSYATVKVYPNPFQEKVNIHIEGIPPLNLKVYIYDCLGRLVKTKQVYDTTISIDREKLHNGIYFYYLEANDQLISTGKIIAQNRS